MKTKDLPNIILFVPDEMRGDCISLSGKYNPIIQTPNIDRIVNDGVAFIQCFTVNPVCGPSRCCTFTGQYIHTNAHRSLYQLLRPYEENLFKFLKMRGYEVIWIGRNDLFTKRAIKKSVSKDHRIDKILIGKFIPELLSIKFIKKAFQRKALREILLILKNLKKLNKDYSFLEYKIVKEFINTYFKTNPYSENHPLRKSFYYGERNKKQADDIDTYIIKRALKFLNSHPKRPFCLYIALNFPHPPYYVEEPYFSMYNREKVPEPIPPKLDNKPKFMQLIYERYGLNKLSENDFREIKATYYGMVSRVDHQFGLIINKLKEIGEYDNTAIFFFADHGDYTGDYGLTEKWPNAFQDCLIKIPLIIKIPGINPIKKINNELIQSIDIFPTILEIAKIKTPYTHFGKSIIPLIQNDVKTIRDAVFSEGGYNLNEPQCFEVPVKNPSIPFLGIYYDKTNIPVEDPSTVARSVMIRTKEWKLIIRNGIKEELYNLKADPKELNNLIDDNNYMDIILQLKEQLLRWYLNTSDNPYWVKIRNI
ncbi:MAG: sulfatase-like hydrolase/transferase [Candidatus Helarchaeota archaeon]